MSSSNAGKSDESALVGQFSAITGVNPTEATNWLEMSGFVLQDSIDLFFSANPGDHQQGQVSTHTSSTSGDAALAASLASSSDPVTQSNSSRRGSFDDPFGDDEDIRRPDRVKRQRLLDSANKSSSYLEAQVNKSILSAFVSGNSTGMGSSGTDSHGEIGNDGNNNRFSNKTKEKETTLASLYHPPVDIMSHTTFEGAKETAKAQDKWLLVNIQKDTEFQCHQLNCDFWAEEGIKDMVQCSFVFWQQLDITQEARIFIDRYKVQSYPHITILDPRTGAVVWKHKLSSSLDTKKLTEQCKFLCSSKYVYVWCLFSLLYQYKCMLHFCVYSTTYPLLCTSM
mmetsp:Transcript_8801/g.14640  ORF Transcript_8801/g.14640 Transcript_8801/m.14640 type:complete len:339 (+) Transcript_8801:73-1089(+)